MNSLLYSMWCRTLMPEQAEQHLLDVISAAGVKLKTDSYRSEIAVGINSVTKYLELLIAQCNSNASPKETDSKDDKAKETVYIIACINDVPSIAAFEHLPIMSQLIQQSKSSSHGPVEVYLCPLRKGSEKRLAQLFGINRCTVAIFNSTKLLISDDSKSEVKDIEVEQEKRRQLFTQVFETIHGNLTKVTTNNLIVT